MGNPVESEITTLSFGPVIERTAEEAVSGASAIDRDTGAVPKPPLAHPEKK